ncbi:hypothetical protein [Curtobacterium citreum]|uniref:hypothetical protein n=1 Tax=Curtobacterium citreum TaxID=2036 RepID=UPI0007371A41|nr:hypothetical protein [Curtobacterium citreum]KTR21396.1 hypothetical protein NS330_05175 [Curtobacterium citreum]
METQPGARTPLVDPFGREVEEWLRDAPATRTPYLADLVVPPVTGPVQRPDTVVDTAPVDAEAEATQPDPIDEEPADEAPATVAAEAAVAPEATSFRRRDRARHVAACAPSFPEPPERLALRIEDLAVELSAATGRTTLERIVLLEDEIRRRDEDLARLAAWEATVAHLDDAEVEAARAFARTVFADLLADAAAEADRRDRAAAGRAATGSLPTPVRPAPARTVPAVPGVTQSVAAAAEPVRPVLSLPVVSPVSANTRPTPLVQPATGPTVIDRAAFAAALSAHAGVTASTPVVLPEAVMLPAAPESSDATVEEPASDARPGWWSRFVARLLGLFGRR